MKGNYSKFFLVLSILLTVETFVDVYQSELRNV